MSQRIKIGLAVLALSAGLMGCEKTRQNAPVPTSAPAGFTQTQAETEAASQAAYEAEADPQPSEPVAAWLWREERCLHLAGEFGGDNSEQDKDVNRLQDALRCGDDLIADGRALRVAHRSDPAAVAKIDAALKAYVE